MKNFLLLFIICISFQHCITKKLTSEQNKIIEKYQIPEFSNSDVTNFSIEYTLYFQDLMTAAKAGDATKLQELNAQSVEWTKKAFEITQKMTPEDAQKWVEWTSKLSERAINR